MLDQVGPVMRARMDERIAATQAEWVSAARADKEFGGDKLQENLATANKALEAFATPELRAWLVETGAGNHPEVIRAFYRIGQAISEDRFVGGRSSGGAQQDARRMYPTSNMNP